MNEPPLPAVEPTAAAPGKEAGDARWERATIEKLLLESLNEKRRARRWGIFLKLLFLGWLTVALLAATGWLSRDMTAATVRHTALVDLKGVIAADAEASADDIIAALRSAFEDTKTAAVVLRINSPGGSPVQAGIIHDEILRLRAKYPQTPLYAVVDEICASGGYYVAAAADRIFVDKASLVGSIGVIMEGFGFTGAMEKLGVERRLLTAGENKGFLDSFSPLPEEQRRFAQEMLDDIHRQFIDAVKKGRGDRLKDDPQLFSGLVWTGARSIDLGLADALGSLDVVARDVVKVEEVVDFTQQRNLAERLAKRFGASAGETMGRSMRALGEAVRLR
ncbi:MAG: peptidase S49 [Lautropia sp. SCN 66-9]|nr:MAG: peptidase S49 [Lautropia sp. SCN 66-9]